jgi:hypothetical protein
MPALPASRCKECGLETRRFQLNGGGSARAMRAGIAAAVNNDDWKEF